MLYKNKDLVGNAVGHYVSYSKYCLDTTCTPTDYNTDGSASNLAWTSVDIYKQTDDYLDVIFTANEGDFHWVIYPDLVGAYQYFINRALPILGEFRSLWRLDNGTFLNGHTDIKDGPLPTLAQIAASVKVQDETWLQADGTYITKYDWNDVIRNPEFYGVYGSDFGSWVRSFAHYMMPLYLSQPHVFHETKFHLLPLTSFYVSDPSIASGFCFTAVLAKSQKARRVGCFDKCGIGDRHMHPYMLTIT